MTGSESPSSPVESATPNPSEPMGKPESQGDHIPPGDGGEESAPVRKWLHLLVLLLMAIGVAAVGLIAFLYTRFLDPEAMRYQFETQVSQAVGLPVRVGKIRLEFPAVHLSQVEIGSAALSADQPRVHAEAVTVTPDFWELLNGRILFENLVLASAGIDVVRGVDGSLLLGSGRPQTSTPESTSASAAFDLPFRMLSLRDIVVRIDDRGKGRILTANLEKAELTDAPAGKGRPISFAVKLDDQVQVAFSGLLLSPLGVDGDLTVGGLDRSNLQPWLPSGVVLPPELGQPTVKTKVRYLAAEGLILTDLAISGKDGLDITGQVKLPSLSPVNGTIHLDLQPLATDRLLELARPFLPVSAKDLKLEKGLLGGGFDLTLSGGVVSAWQGHARPQGVNLKAAALPLPIDALEGTLTFEKGTLRWEKLAAKLPGITLQSAKGRIGLDDLRGEADLAFDMDTAPAFAGSKKLLPTAISGYDPSGKLDFSGTLTIDGAASRASGKLSAQKVRFKPVPGKLPVEIERGSIELKDISAKHGRVAISELAARVLDMPVKISGELTNGADPSFALKGEASIDLGTAFEALPLEIHDLRRSAKVGGKASVKARLEGSVKKPVFEADADLTGASLTLLGSGFSIADVQGRLRADQKGMTVSGAKGRFAGGRLELDGRITDFDKPQVLASGSLSGVDLGQVRALLGKLLPSFPSDLSFNGVADLDIAISGPGGAPNLRGNAVLTGASFQHPALMRPLRSIVGPIKFDNQTISTEGLKAAWGSSTVQVVGRVSDLSKFKLDFDYSVQPLDLTDIGGFFLAGTGYRIDGMGHARGRVVGPIEKMVLDGTAEVPSGSFEAPISKTDRAVFKFPFTALNAPFKLTDGVLEINKAKCGIYSGALESTGKIFLRETPIRFAFDTTGTNLVVQEFLAANTRFKDVLTGSLNLNAKTNGNTTGLVSLDGGIDTFMKSGSYKAPPVAAQIFSMLQADQLSAGILENLKGKMVVKGGQIITDDLGFKTKQGQLVWRGSMGLDTSLKGTVDLQLTNEACQSSSILRQLVGKRPTFEIPIGVKGSLLAPAIDLNVENLLKKAAGNALEDVARREAENFLGGLLGGKKKKDPVPQPAPQPAPVPVPVAQPTPFPTPSPNVVLIEGPDGKLIPATSTVITTPPVPMVPPPVTVPAPASQAAPVEPPKPLSPEKQIKQEMKKLEKDLKKIFKF